MRTLSRKKRTFLWIAVPVLIVVSLGFMFLQYLFDPAFYKRILEDSLSRTLGREVSIGEARVNLWEGVGITFEDFRVQDRSRAFDLVRSRKLFLRARLLPLLRREVQWARVILEEPVLRLTRDAQGQLNFVDGLLAGHEPKEPLRQLVQALSTFFGGSLTIKEGHVIFTDQGLGQPDLKTEIRSFSLHVSKVSYRKPFPFRVDGKIVDSKGEGRFSISGTVRDIPEDLDFSKAKIEAKTEIKGVDLSHFWPYIRSWLPMRTLAGTLDVSGQYRGDFAGAFKTTARMSLREVVLDYPQVFSYVHTPKWLNLSVDADVGPKEIHVSQVHVELPEIQVEAKGRIHGIGTETMAMEAEAKSGIFDLADGKKWIPYRVITPDVSEALFRAEGKGPVQIVSVRLAGKMPEVDHCDEPQNSHVLSVEMKLNGVRVKLPWNLPAFNDFKGNLVFKNGHLNLRKLEGRIFHSTMENVNGVFSDLLHTCTLQFETEGRFELIDLSSLAKTDLFPSDVSVVLSSFQVQSGKASYRLAARGVIAPPYRFQHQGSYLLSNARLTHRHIPFPVQVREGKVDVSDVDLRWAQTRVNFGQTSLLSSGSWKYREQGTPMETLIKGRVDLKDLQNLSQSPLFPEEVRVKAKEIEAPGGTGQLSLSLKSLSDPSRLSFEGEFAPRDASFQIKGTSLPMALREGTLSFSNQGLRFSKTRVQALNSFLLLEGSLRDGRVRLSTTGSLDLRNLPSLLQFSLFPDWVRSQAEVVKDLRGEAEVSMRWQGEVDDWATVFKEGQVKLKGVSFSHPKIPVPLSQIEGPISVSADQFQFQMLKGRLGETQITVSGGIPRPPLPGAAPSETKRRVTFHIVSPLLDLDLFFPKKTEAEPTSLEAFREVLTDWQIEGRVEAEQVKYQGLYYQDLKMEAKTIDERLRFYPFQFKGAGGDFWGEGWFQPAERGIRFEIKPRVSNMEARALMRIISPRAREGRVAYTGRFHLDRAELRGEGEDLQKIKESLTGSLRLELANGAIDRSNILSKVFSILNVSQFFKGRVPDLKTRGLPFQRIIANFQFKDGVASTEDLLVDSDAMRITGIGKVDVARNQVDAKVGIHPFGTFDTVLSKIPIAGYILTGKDKAFLSFVYEVKGDLSDPKVEAVPIQSLGEGVFGILKRLLETPIRPFQKIPDSSKSEKNSREFLIKSEP